MLVWLRKFVWLALNLTTLAVSFVGLSKSVTAGGRGLINPELYHGLVHVKPLARCLSGRATIAENKGVQKRPSHPRQDPAGAVVVVVVVVHLPCHMP